MGEALSQPESIEVYLESFIETHKQMPDILPMVDFLKPAGADMQNASNTVWKPVRQHRPIIEGFDVTGEETGIIEETCPFTLNDPVNDVIQLRADEVRDETYWRNAGEESARKQAAEANIRTVNKIIAHGSQFYRSNTTSGYTFIGKAKKILRQTQQWKTDCYFMLNDEDEFKFATDLAGRQNVVGRPEEAWAEGQIGSKVAGFDVLTGSFLSNLVGDSDPATTVTATVTFAPTGGSTSNSDKTITNVDYRTADIAVTSSASYVVNDKITFANSGTTVKSLALMGKTNTNQAMTFTIVAIADATTITVFPKPIAADDANLNVLEKAYANINTQILSTATVNRQNVDTQQANVFWDKTALTMLAGTLPIDKFGQYGGMQVITETLSNGIPVYILYDADIRTLDFTFRMTLWYEPIVCVPSNCGVAVTY